ncbi:MAG TPA: sugar ABC transporter substrate-binding protein [Burkholderiales bacterium]|nr:sugar ABC transporter substrate-binding protein [Burkholderiales bacterium]
MKDDRRTSRPQPAVDSDRRRILKQGAILGAAALGAPWVMRHAHAADVGAYQQAKINWRQAEGQSITVAVIPASYFQNLISITPEFEALTGIKVRYDKVPPGQIRQKAILDLTSKTGTYATHAADPMYYPLYVSNKWIDPLDRYLNDDKLTDPKWFDYDGIIKGWREADSLNGKPYGMPYDGEVTVQVYRKDLYDAKGLKPADTLEDFVKNAAAINDPGSRIWGCALRGFAGAGQNMYIYPSIFREFGGDWMSGGQVRVNGPKAVEALDWYISVLSKYAPSAVRNWNWPDIADAFSQGTLGVYIDANSSATVLNNPAKSKVIGKIGYARWPKGPSGKRVTSIWNWGFPINGALSEKAKRATWLFITWAASLETQVRTSWKFSGSTKRPGINRTSLWRNPDFTKVMSKNGYHFVEASLESLEHDTDVDWRPRVPQWPAIGDIMATEIQAALVGQKQAKQALDEAQARINGVMKKS